MDKTKINLLPRLSEKTYTLSNSQVYVVDVPKSANKHDVKRAIETQFSVKVAKVNMTVIPGKSKRTVSRGGRRVANGKNSDIKKAYITLIEGNKLPFFEAIEEEEKQAQKVQEEITKKHAKEQSKDEEKPKTKRRSIRTKSKSKEDK
jgi:large subunit ribosomal protein L23